MGSVSFSGLASGIDTEALIQATLDARRIQQQPMKNTKAFNDQETTAFQEFNTKLLSLSSNLLGYTTAFGGGVTKSVSSSNSDAITATAAAGAPTTSTQITVNQLAKSALLSFGDYFSDYDTPIASALSEAGAMKLTIGQGDNAETFSIDIDKTTSLTGLVDKINNSADGKLRASTINVGTETNPKYILMVNGTASGSEKGLLNVEVSNNITDLGLFNQQTMEQAQDAQLYIAGIGQITRPSNEIKDLVPGLSLELKQVTAAPVLLTVSSDADKTAKKFGGIIAQLNEIIKYSKDNNKVQRIEENGKVANVFSALAKSRVDDNFVRAIQSVFTETHSDVNGSKISVLADLGITTNRDGTYNFDETKFSGGFKDDPVAAQALIQKIADKLASTKGVVAEYTRFDGQIKLAIKANDTENESINKRIERMEELLTRQTESMKLLYARLEENMAKLQSNASSLTSMLSSLSTKK
ncbi:MAG: flagellar filament capping protein FliD [Deltaproteobacteria bacterium]|nr:flagellar filament capping protein FliD [Deltaproteobacteria bacterium]